MSVAVTLSVEEIQVARFVGAARYERAVSGDYENRIPGFVPNLERDVGGAAAELAVAKTLDRYWTGLSGRRAAADVGRNTQVRSTHHRRGQLVVHDEDPSDAYFFLVVRPEKIEPGPADVVLTVVGFLHGSACKARHWWVERPHGSAKPGYWIPQRALRDVAAVVPGAAG